MVTFGEPTNVRRTSVIAKRREEREKTFEQTAASSARNVNNQEKFTADKLKKGSIEAESNN